MLKVYKYRIYPNNEQKIQIAKTFGCCRFVYNQTLAYRKEVYEKEKKSVSKTDCNNYCNRQLKKEYEWLKEVDKFALTNAIYNMDAAYQKFFKEHAGYPKFKSKHNNHKSYTTNFTNGNIKTPFIRFFAASLAAQRRSALYGAVGRKENRPLRISNSMQPVSGSACVKSRR